jgi:hypothetical protein
MFRTPVVVVPDRTETQFVTREIHEHRAPTDESVKLLREMEAKARKQVLDSIRLGDTAFECVVHVTRDTMSGDTSLMAIFSLNGKKFTVEHREWRPDTKLLVEGLRAAMANKIATEILVPALQSLDSRVFER